MTQTESEEVWDELRALRAELDDLKVVRERLAKQATSLHKLRDDLEVHVSTVERLAAEADELLAVKDAHEAQAQN